MEINIMDFIKPELLTLVPVLLIIGKGLKIIKQINNKYIPLILGCIGIFLAIIWVLGTTANIQTLNQAMSGIFIALTQGILCAGASVYVENFVKKKVIVLVKNNIAD
ncbi:MAG: phage holin family protein [Clostridiales bacterium]